MHHSRNLPNFMACIRYLAAMHQVHFGGPNGGGMGVELQEDRVQRGPERHEGAPGGAGGGAAGARDGNAANGAQRWICMRAPNSLNTVHSLVTWLFSMTQWVTPHRLTSRPVGAP